MSAPVDVRDRPNTASRDGLRQERGTERKGKTEDKTSGREYEIMKTKRNNKKSVPMVSHRNNTLHSCLVRVGSHLHDSLLCLSMTISEHRRFKK